MSETFTVEVQRKCMSWKNSIRCSPPPKYRALIQAMTEENEDKKVGSTLNYIVRHFFDSMPPHQRHKLLQKSKNHY